MAMINDGATINQEAMINSDQELSTAQRVRSVLNGIDDACRVANREPGSVRLMPVSKLHSVDEMRAVEAALDAADAVATPHSHDAHPNGVKGDPARLYGENHVQEIVAKSADLGTDDGFGFALIGHLQSNKVNAVAGLISEFQALDSLKLAGRLDRRLESLDRSLRVLVEVNTSGEQAKQGVDWRIAREFCASLAPFEHLQVAGLMTVAVKSDNPEEVAACFDRLVSLQTQLRDDAVLGSEWAELSMGMSGDYRQAIAHGATTVRVGTALFGPRDYGR